MNPWKTGDGLEAQCILFDADSNPYLVIHVGGRVTQTNDPSMDVGDADFRAGGDTAHGGVVTFMTLDHAKLCIRRNEARQFLMRASCRMKTGIRDFFDRKTEWTWIKMPSGLVAEGEDYDTVVIAAVLAVGKKENEAAM